MKSLEPKSQFRSNRDVDQMTTVRDSMVYARHVINVHVVFLSMSSVSIHVSLKHTCFISANIIEWYYSIAEINSLTQMQ